MVKSRRSWTWIKLGQCMGVPVARPQNPRRPAGLRRLRSLGAAVGPLSPGNHGARQALKGDSMARTTRPRKRGRTRAIRGCPQLAMGLATDLVKGRDSNRVADPCLCAANLKLGGVPPLDGRRVLRRLGKDRRDPPAK